MFKLLLLGSIFLLAGLKTESTPSINYAAKKTIHLNMSHGSLSSVDADEPSPGHLHIKQVYGKPVRALPSWLFWGTLSLLALHETAANRHSRMFFLNDHDRFLVGMASLYCAYKTYSSLKENSDSIKKARLAAKEYIESITAEDSPFSYLTLEEENYGLLGLIANKTNKDIPLNINLEVHEVPICQ